LFHRFCGIQRLAEGRHNPKPMAHLFGEVSNDTVYVDAWLTSVRG